MDVICVQDAVDNQQDMANALSELLTGKITSPEMEGEGGQIEPDDMGSDPSSTAFSCHLCKQVFTKRKALQKHITSHQDYRPSVVWNASKFSIISQGFNKEFYGSLRYHLFLHSE